ncbi:hypothetical protein LA6_001907 [Marinibacterium anthonyi]|nr:hypothetical protein LA6_001907 [Marinibacterium anthonyi]
MRLVLAICALLVSGAATADPVQSVAFFGVTLLNTSMEPVSEAETARLAAAEAQIVQTMTDSGRFTFVDTAPIAEKADLYSNLAQCNGCDSAFAHDLGADLAMTGEFQKTSNLILSFTLYLRDATTGDLVGGGSADIRGNTDESWQRGVSYILRNRILK